MRRKKKQMESLKVKVLEDRRDGLTYKQIENKRGVSSRTIANLLKGGDPQRFCGVCAETNPEKLEEHHIDRVNRPNETITLCANHHGEISRKQQRERIKEKKDNEAVQVSSPPAVSAGSSPAPVSTQTAYPAKPLTPEQQRSLGEVLCYGVGSAAFVEGLFNKNLPGLTRIVLGIAGIGLFYQGSKLR